MRCWLSSGLPGMFCAMSSLDVLFFTFRRLEFTTLQPSKVDGLVDAVCGLPCGIYALLQYLPVFLSQFSTGLLRLLRGPDMWRARSCTGIADGKHSTSVQSLLLFSTFQLLYTTISLYNHTTAIKRSQLKMSAYNNLNYKSFYSPYTIHLSASAVVIHYEEALYQVYVPWPFTFYTNGSIL